MTSIENIIARKILDSRGNYTVEAEVILGGGVKAIGRAPAGASTGQKEALAIPVGMAIKNIEQIIKPKLIGKSVFEQAVIDQYLIDIDGTENKSALGANAIIAVSLAVLRAGARAKNLSLYQYVHSIYNQSAPMSLPVPLMNVINGGAHADNNLDIQEFMLVPHGAKSFSEAITWGVECFHYLKSVLKRKSMSTAVGDEGGFAPSLRNNQEALDLLMQSIEQAGFKAGTQISFGLDVAANELYIDNVYKFRSDNKSFDSRKLVDYYKQLSSMYPIISIEDGLAENDWDGWAYMSEQLGSKIQIVGDDIFVTNSKLLEMGISKQIANAILIKFNQIGTITETLNTVKQAQLANYACVISHRSGETEDTSIADLAVGLNCGQIKTGSLSRTDRVAKYNQLLRIEEQLGTHASYAGSMAFRDKNA